MNFLIVITGPTGIGKTKTAIELAKLLQTEVVSADSRQFFKEIPIGTAAPTLEEMQGITHHFVGHLSVTDYYNAYKFQEDVITLLPHLFQKNQSVIMCGGSGMYIDAVCSGIDDIPDIDPELRAQIIQQYEQEGIESLRLALKKLDQEYYAQVDLKNPARLMRAIEVCIQTGKPYSEVRTNTNQTRDFSCSHIALSMEREQLYERINSRVDAMITAGLEQEAKSVYNLKNCTALKTVGYRELFEYFEHQYSFETAVEKIKQHSRHYAKRQISWIKRNENYKWFEPNQITEIYSYITSKINKP